MFLLDFEVYLIDELMSIFHSINMSLVDFLQIDIPESYPGKKAKICLPEVTGSGEVAATMSTLGSESRGSSWTRRTENAATSKLW